MSDSKVTRKQAYHNVNQSEEEPSLLPIACHMKGEGDHLSTLTTDPPASVLPVDNNNMMLKGDTSTSPTSLHIDMTKLSTLLSATYTDHHASTKTSAPHMEHQPEEEPFLLQTACSKQGENSYQYESTQRPTACDLNENSTTE